jgi:hypothetical protein
MLVGMFQQTAFGGMLQDVVERQAIVFRPEPLDTIVERRCKHAWEQAPCPECGETVLQTRGVSPRVWCRNCRYSFTYTRNTPFANSGLTPGELILIFILYADTLLSINQIAQLFDPCYDTVHAQLREGEAAFERGFPLVWERIQHIVEGPTQIDETGSKCSGYKGQSPPRDGLSRGGSGDPGRSRWEGAPGDKLTLVAACRDVLRVVSAEEGSAYDENLGPVIEEAGDLSQPLGEIWTDELPAYQKMEHEHRTVVHDDEYVSDEGIHTNQVECLWSLIEPWLEKFRGLSKPGLEQSVRTYGFVRTLNLVGAPLHGLIDCFVLNVFHQIR